MFDTFLFDLDGTLLPLDMDEFIGHYLKKVGAYFQDMIDPDLLLSHVWAGQAMLNNQGDKTNEKAFMDVFGNCIKEILLYFKKV